MSNKKQNKKFYKLSRAFLMQMADDCGISGKNLKEYFENPKKDYKTINDVLYRLIYATQNYNRFPNIIKYKERKKEFYRIFFEYDSEKILNSYTDKSLYEEIRKSFDLDKDDCTSTWEKWCKSVLSCAKFMNEFEDIKNFRGFVKLFDRDIETRWLLAELMEYKIYGVGTALACDFLKEIGYLDYSKPDIHLLDVFEELDLTERDNFQVYERIAEIAENCETTSFEIDRMIWLICSGNFYHHLDTKTPQKIEFIEYMQENL